MKPFLSIGFPLKRLVEPFTIYRYLNPLASVRSLKNRAFIPATDFFRHFLYSFLNGPKGKATLCLPIELLRCECDVHILTPFVLNGHKILSGRGEDINITNKKEMNMI